MSLNFEANFFSERLRSVVGAIQAGQDINKYGCANIYEHYYFTPLGYAMNYNHLDIFKYLMRRGADINKNVSAEENERASTPLWFAVENKYYHFVELLLKHGAEKTFNAKRCSLLTHAVAVADLVLFNCLIKNGDDVNQVDGRGQSPLLTAVRERRIGMLKALLDCGAEFSLQNALIEAIALEELEITELLIEKGGDINFQSVTGFTPLTEAAKNGSLQISKVLVEKGADVNLLDIEGRSPLVISVRHAQLDLVRLLVENGASIQQADSHGNLPITEALNTKDFPVISFLIEHGADWSNMRDKDGCSPLVLSVQKRDFDMLKFFLDRKVDVNEADNDQKTALLLAVETDNLRFAKILTEHGASVDAVIEKIGQRASADDNWKKFFLELNAERKILEDSGPIMMQIS